MASHAQPLSADALPRAVGAQRGLRVCHIVSGDLWAGAEVQVATVASYLVERPDVNLSAVLLNEGRLASELRRLGVQVTVIDESRNSAVRIVTLLTRYLREHHVEVVHTHRYKESVVGSIAAKLAGVPHVIRTVHGMPEPMRGWDRVKAWAYGAVDRATLWWFADLIIAVSKRMAETLKDSGYAPTPVTHIHNGVDPRKVRATRTGDAVTRELGIGPRALLVAPRDERALADACLELARNRDWAQTFGARARRVVDEAFSHERNGHALMEVYRRVTSGRELGGTERPRP